MKKIKVITAKKTDWYHDQIGSIFNVDECTGDYKLSGLIAAPWISMRDCEVIEEPTPQPEPFDLERAKAGDPVQIAVGIPVNPFVFVPEINMFVGEFVIDDRYRYQEKGAVTKKMWNLEGKVYTGFADADRLFMAPKEPEYVEGYVIVYRGVIRGVYHSYETAKMNVAAGEVYPADIHKIRFLKP